MGASVELIEVRFFFKFCKLAADQVPGFDCIAGSSQVNLQCIVRITFHKPGGPLLGLAKSIYYLVEQMPT